MSVSVVEYTVREGACPVDTWYAIERLGIPRLGGPLTKRTGFVRARIDLDGTVVGIWDWVTRKWVAPETVKRVNMARSQMTGEARC